MSAPEAGLRRVAAPVALSLILLTVAAAPLVASWRLAEPAPAAAPARELPALPQPRAGAPATLSGELDTLPLIPTDLPDPASRAAADRLRTLPVQDGPADRQTFADQWAALPAEGAAREQLDRLGGALLTDQAVAPSGDQDAATLQIDERLAPLRADPANGDRLHDAALALLALALAQIEGRPASGVAPPAALLHHTSTLLGAAAAAFPESRALTLDRALLARLPGMLAGGAAPLPALESWVNAHPQDRTARYLLAQQLATGGEDAGLTGEAGAQPGSVPGAGDRAGLARALQVVQPLVQQAPALGYAARGDAELAAADLGAADAPGAARQSAWAALTDYDRALRLNADPGLYAARGAALDTIAAPDPEPEDGPVYREAVRSLQVAHARQPQAASYALQLAHLEEKTGDVASMRTHARQAMRAAAAGEPALGEVRLTAAPRPLAIFGGDAADLPLRSGDRGFGGSSAGSGDPQLAVWPLGGAAAGTYEPSDDLVPTSRLPDLDTAERAGSPLDAGAATALRADVLLGDTQAAAADRAAWERAVAQAAGAAPDLQAERARVVDAYAAAASLVVTGAVPAGADPDQTLALASSTLRRAGRYPEAAGLCERAGAGRLVTDRAVAYECAGESWYLAGPDHGARARDDLAEARRLAAAPGSRTAAVGDELVLETATVQAQQQPDQLQQARDALTGLATRQGSRYRAIAWKELGDLALDRHDPRAALSAYADALAAFDPRRDAANPQAVAAARLAHVNRAIARLLQAQPSPNVPPCQGRRSAADPCELARADLVQALEQDPGDAVAHLDLARVDRLQSRGPGDGRDREARAESAEAVQIDPRLAAATRQPGGGDRAAARESLEAATRASPTYDLAFWNLGVLELGDGPAELLSHPLDPLLAQGHLARALQLQAAFGADQLEPAYEQDEHLYRGSGAAGYALLPFEQAQEWTAAALGGLALLAGLTALVRVGGAPAREHGLRVAGQLVERHGGRLADPAGRALRAAGRLPGGRHPWLTTLPVLALLTTVSAALAAPAAGAVLWILFAVAVGLAARELGHWLWARWERLRSSAARWGWGYPLSLLLVVLPVSAAVGPYVGHRTEPPDAEGAFGVSLSGVLTNVAVFVAAFTLLLVYPLPALRLLAVVQLGIIGWSLLPFEPLDGWILLRHRPLVDLGIMAALVAVSVALAVGGGGWLLS